MIARTSKHFAALSPAMLYCWKGGIESSTLMAVPCATNMLPDGQIEFIHLARMFEHSLGSVVSPRAGSRRLDGSSRA